MYSKAIFFLINHLTAHNKTTKMQFLELLCSYNFSLSNMD